MPMMPDPPPEAKLVSGAAPVPDLKADPNPLESLPKPEDDAKPLVELGSLADPKVGAVAEANPDLAPLNDAKPLLGFVSEAACASVALGAVNAEPKGDAEVEANDAKPDDANALVDVCCGGGGGDLGPESAPKGDEADLFAKPLVVGT